MEQCYKYLGCFEKDCVMYGEKSQIRCWKTEGTLCNHEAIKIVREETDGKKEDACKRSCIYYKEVMKYKQLI